MALLLHVKYGFSYDNIKVLQGGWYGWQDANLSDPTEYPIDTGSDTNTYRERVSGVGK